MSLSQLLLESQVLVCSVEASLTFDEARPEEQPQPIAKCCSLSSSNKTTSSHIAVTPAERSSRSQTNRLLLPPSHLSHLVLSWQTASSELPLRQHLLKARRYQT
eukprot:m.6852 g.6852  ORF g.6852 m.6852 type:complete len:104 (+) comp8617_c0_seq1:233-544(+)